MTSSLHPPDLSPSAVLPRVAWALPTAGCPRGLALAREKGAVLAWDDEGWLYLLSRSGERQAMRRYPAVAAACCADDGSACAVARDGGEICWLAPDLSPRWQTNLPQRVVAVALDPFGRCLAAADARGHLRLFDCKGRPLASATSPRPLLHLAFVPEAPFLAAADYGLVASYDLAGKCAWSDRLVANIGSLAVSAAGSRIAVACYTEGLVSFSLSGKQLGRQKTEEPCRLLGLSADGRLALAGGLGNRLFLLGPDGKALTVCPLDRPPLAVALAPLGERAVAALPGRRVMGLDLRGVVRR